LFSSQRGKRLGRRPEASDWPQTNRKRKWGEKKVTVEETFRKYNGGVVNEEAPRHYDILREPFCEN